MNNEEFSKLPMLLRREDVLRLLGINSRTLDQIRAADPGVATVVPGMRQVRYRKVILAKYVLSCDESSHGAVGRSF